MWKRAWSCFLALSVLCVPALAEVFAGETVATQVSAVAADAGGVVDALCVGPGDAVEVGDVLGTVAASPVFAAQDGTVAVLHAAEGQDVSGTVLELAPVELYTICCTVGGAYESPRTQWVQMGEQVYVRCKVDGTHRAVGVVTDVDDDGYQVRTIGGELYVGEAVRLYRDDAFSSAQCLGAGTVLASETESYAAEGRLVELCVSEGEPVERGELLYRIADGQDLRFVCETAGIVTGTLISQGERVERGQTVAYVAPLDGIVVEICVDEATAACIRPGDSAGVVLASDEETELSGTVESVCRLPSQEGYAVRIRTEEALDRIGLSAEVRLGN